MKKKIKPKLKKYGDGGSVEENKKILKSKGILPEQEFKRNKYQELLSNNLHPIGYDYNSFIHAFYGKNKGREVLENRAKDTDPYASNLIPKSRLDAFNFYMGKPQKYNTFDISDYRPSKETDSKTNYYKLNYFQDYYAPDSNVTDLENLFKTKSLAQTDFPFLFSKKEKQKVNANDAPVMANYTLSKGEDEKGKYYSYYDKWDIAPMDFGKPFEIYDRIYYDPSTNKIIPPKKPYIQKAPLPGQSVQVLEFKNGGSIKQFDNGGRQSILGTPQQYQAYQDSMFIHNDGERLRNLLINPSTTESVYANQVSRYYTGNAINQNNPTNQALSRLNTLNGEFPAVESTQRRTFPSGYTSYASLYKKPVQPIILDRPKENIIPLNQEQQYLPQSEQHLDFDPIGLKKGTYFTRPRQQQEAGQGSVDYFDNKTGKLLKTKQFGNGGKYEWSKGIDNIQPVTQTNSTSSITTGNKKLSTEELKKAAEYTKQYNQKHLEEEYNNRQSKLKASVDAQKQPLSLKNLQTQTQSTGDKFSLAMNTKYGNPKDYPTLSGYMEGLDYINPAKIIGDMSSGIGSVPQDVKDGNYLKAGMSIGSPLFTGAVAGIGTKGIKPFVNNLTNPLAGTGEIIDNLGNKYLPNAYKLNPFAFKPNPNNFYRQVDNQTFQEGLESGLIKGKQNIGDGGMDGININKAFGDDAYYNKGRLYYKNNKDLPYLFEANLPEEKFIPKVNGRTRKYTTENTSVRVSKEPLSLNDPGITIHKKDWLKGYKPIEIPKKEFKSEINWGKWNKEIPENTQLLEEYNTIEQTSKANGSWMKNPDGSPFQGSPEQFIQQNSQNFKKAFGNSIVRDEKGDIIKMYHGSINKEPLTEYITPKRLKDFKRRTQTTKETDHTFFSPKKEIADKYSKRDLLGNDRGIIYENYINVKNPYFTDDYIDLATPHNLPNINNYDAVTNMKFGKDYSPKNYSELAIPFGNNVKSAIGNNGMFDMTNPNIYKALFPAAIGLGAASQIDKKEFGGNIITENEWEIVNDNKTKLPKRKLNLKKSNSDWEIIG